MTTKYKTTEWNNKKVILGEPDLDNEKPVNLLIGFHGASSTPENMLVLGNRLKTENTIMIFPEGTISAGDGIWSWWEDGPRQKETVASFLEYTSQIIENAKQHYLSKNPERKLNICFWGFSQGGAASLTYTLLGSHTPFKVGSICGFLPEFPDQEIPKKEPLDILGIFGLNDDVVPSFLAEYALEVMSNSGHKVEAKESTQGHEVSVENLNNLSAFFNQ